ncbi:hypothetical protein CF140_21220 [Aeromonas sobria]|nr:hypothetical protein CF140_21220 [Aeromonas sobria]
MRSRPVLPCPYHRYYFKEKEMLSIEMGEYYKGETRAQVVQRVEKDLFTLYQDPHLNHKPKELEMRGGAYYSDAACEVISAIYNDRHSEHYVIVPHHGQIKNIPADWTVEMTCRIGRDGAKPDPRLNQFDEKVLGLIHGIKAFEIAAAKAAVTGSFNDLLVAMNINPLVHSDDDARRVATELLLAHKKYLPQFAETISELD